MCRILAELRRLSFVSFLLLTIIIILPSGATRFANAAEMLHNIVLDLAKGKDPVDGPYRFRCPVFGKCNHRIVGMFQTQRAGFPEIWVVAAIPNEESCRACASRMTIEVYRKDGGQWRKYRVWRNFAEWGNWGIVRPEEVRLGKIDERRMILFLQGGATHMGQTIEAVETFIIDDEDITPVRRFCIYYDNEAAITPETPLKHEKWSARYQLTTVDGKPALVFHLRDEVRGEKNTVVYEVMGKGLRLRFPGDERLENGC